MILQLAKSKRVRTMPLALALWISSVVAAPPVLACCDNFFSRAAAVVTASATAGGAVERDYRRSAGSFERNRVITDRQVEL